MACPAPMAPTIQRIEPVSQSLRIGGLIAFIIIGLFTTDFSHPLALGASQSSTKPASSPLSSPESTLQVHITAPPSLLTSVYTKAEDDIRREREQYWIPLTDQQGSLRVPWWRQRLSWKLVGPRLDVDESLHFSLIHGSPPLSDLRSDRQVLAHCGSRPPADVPGLLHVKQSATLVLTPGYTPRVTARAAQVNLQSLCKPTTLTVDPGPVIKAELSIQRERMTQLIGDGLAKNWPIRDRVGTVWSQLQEPILLDEATQTWLLLHPTSIERGSIGLHRGLLSATVAVAIDPKLARGSLPPRAAHPLPNAERAASSDRIAATLDIPIPFQEADDRLREALVGQQFGQSLGTVTVQGARFTPAGDRARIDLDLDVGGLATMTLQLTGTPVFDEPTQTVSFARLDYAIKNRSALADFAESLLHEEFRRQLEQRLRFPLEDRLQEARQRANQELNRQWRGGVLQGSVDSLRILRLAMEGDHFVARFRSEGALHFTVPAQSTVHSPKPATRD
ncbi:hypothetical protein YTPLAS18_16360 [Nitrospira sp.]|nr:hypothetical protein YTPLAS18_16360 [Nitrospira sp.]